MCSRPTRPLKYYTLIAVPALILWGCVHLKPQGVQQDPALFSNQSSQQESLKKDDLESTSLDRPEPSAQKSSLERSGKSVEAKPIPPITDQSEKAVSVVTTPEPAVLSKILPDDVSNAPEGLNLSAATLRLQAPTQGILAGGQFIFSIETQHVKDLFSAPFYLSYDPRQLEFIGLTEGEFLKRDKNPTAFIYNVDPERGQVIIGLTRLGNVGGVSGSGTLALATFRARTSGVANVTFQNVDFRDTQLDPVNVVIEGGDIQVR